MRRPTRHAPTEPRPDEEAERADVRSRWPDEGRDFTPWLAEHLDLLGEELGMRLELVRQEQPVGELFLDILARDADADVLVAIENQLESADDGHLGRLLAYATGCDARAAVWVATGFRASTPRPCTASTSGRATASASTRS